MVLLGTISWCQCSHGASLPAIFYLEFLKFKLNLSLYLVPVGSMTGPKCEVLFNLSCKFLKKYLFKTVCICLV
jgi:hypothetical protein